MFVCTLNAFDSTVASCGISDLFVLIDKVIDFVNNRTQIYNAAELIHIIPFLQADVKNAIQQSIQGVYFIQHIILTQINVLMLV